MPAYYIAEINATDPEGFEEYRPLARASIADFGGTFLVAGRNWQALEGAKPIGSVVIIEFESMQVIEDWWNSPDYRKAHDIRARTAESRSFMVEGCGIDPHSADGAAGYYVGERDVHDDAAYKEYAVGAAPTIEAHGGAYMVKAGRWEALEGNAPLPRVVVLRFPSVAACTDWYHSPGYHAVHGIRDRAATSRTYLVEGVA